MANINFITIFLTGLLTGGLTCMAVQGGLLAATIAQTEEKRLEEKIKGGNTKPILAFLTTKIIAYTMLGFLLGLLGSFFQLSLSLQVTLQIAVAVFMIGTALNILNVHPIFRYFIIQPPKKITRLIRKQSKSQDIFAPALLGAFTVFIPCGTTQAMMAFAVASGNPLLGAAILFAFTLGTSPVFFILGYFTTKLDDRFHEKFMRLAAFAIILLALFNLNSAITLTGSPLTVNSLAQGLWCTLSYCDTTETAQVAPPVKQATITITEKAYSPNELTVKAGEEIKLHLQNNDGSNCIQAFTIPQLGIQKVVPLGQSGDVTFTAPNKPGELKFMCSMGMYAGTIHVI